MDFAADINFFYSDFAVDVTLLTSRAHPLNGRAIFDQPGTTVIGGEVLATDYSLRYPAPTFPDVRRDDYFLIGGVSYRARESAQPEGIDGFEHIVPLERRA